MMPPSPSDHPSQPEGFLANYVSLKQNSLAHDVRGRKKIYLDTKYWVLLRDVRLGRSHCSSSRELLDTLEAGVADGSLICPFNSDIFVEVIKQNDMHTLLATARLVDDLSLGICLVPVAERMKLEIVCFIQSCRRPQNSVDLFSRLVWTKIAFAFGMVTPHFLTMPDHANKVVQEAFADHMWTLGLRDMIKVMMRRDDVMRKATHDDIAFDLNCGKRATASEHLSFRSVFLTEVKGILDAFKEELGQVFECVYRLDTGKQPADAWKQDVSSVRMLADLILGAFEANRGEGQFPSLRIWAGLHAAMRWDTSRNFKPNDFIDFRHAVAALPYCDVFLTERALRHLVHDGNLKFSEYFKCETVYRPCDALELIGSIGK